MNEVSNLAKLPSFMIPVVVYIHFAQFPDAKIYVNDIRQSLKKQGVSIRHERLREIVEGFETAGLVKKIDLAEKSEDKRIKGYYQFINPTLKVHVNPVPVTTKIKIAINSIYDNIS